MCKVCNGLAWRLIPSLFLHFGFLNLSLQRKFVYHMSLRILNQTFFYRPERMRKVLATPEMLEFLVALENDKQDLLMVLGLILEKFLPGSIFKLFFQFRIV